MAKKNRDQKRKAKKNKENRKGGGSRLTEFRAVVDPVEDKYLLVRIRLPSDRMPTMGYTGQDALDRWRRWIIGFTEGVADARARRKSGGGFRGSREDRSWFEAPAHGDPIGACWSQKQAGSSAVFDLRLLRWDGCMVGVSKSDEQASERLHQFAEAGWGVVNNLTPEEVVEKLLVPESVDALGNTGIHANGWFFLFSGGELPGDEGRAFNILSAQLRPRGRASNEKDWNFLGAVKDLLGVPARGSDELMSEPDFDTQCPNSVHKWMWRALVH